MKETVSAVTMLEAKQEEHTTCHLHCSVCSPSECVRARKRESDKELLCCERCPPISHISGIPAAVRGGCHAQWPSVIFSDYCFFYFNVRTDGAEYRRMAPADVCVCESMSLSLQFYSPPRLCRMCIGGL